MLIAIDLYTTDEREVDRTVKTIEAHGGIAEVRVLRENEGWHVTGVYETTDVPAAHE
jgi:hypothetical protein